MKISSSNQIEPSQILATASDEIRRLYPHYLSDPAWSNVVMYVDLARTYAEVAQQRKQTPSP